MTSRHEIIGTFVEYRRGCEWENDDGTVTIIGTVRVQDAIDAVPENPENLENWYKPAGSKLVTIKGSIPQNGLRVGMTYRFYGLMRSYENKRTGLTEDQFQFDSYVMEEPAGQEAIVSYLSQCRGIGPKTAFDLYRQYGEEAVAKVRECPEEIAKVLPRFTLEKAKEASELLRSRQKNERAKIDLLGLLKGRGFPKNIVEKLIGDYGVQAAIVAHRNPYALMQYRGVGFLKTDKMYLDLRHNPSRMKRQALCAWHSIAKQGGGDTWFPFSYVRDGLRQNISSATVDIERAMALATRARMLIEKWHMGQRWVAERTKAEHEQRIAELIDEARTEVGNGNFILWDQVYQDLQGITDHQRENLRLATVGFIGVLAGRPGTGKTYTVARLVAQLAQHHGQHHIAIAAPTGKAAVRVTSAMQAVGLSLRATTIHSLLEFAGDKGFQYCRQCPLPFKFVIVDESSMIDTALMQSLLDARAEGCHVLFVGDPNQLAPVGHGAPLRDMIQAEVPHGVLTEIQRNSGRIVKACGEIIDKRRLTPSPKLDFANGENLLLIERDATDSQIETLTAVIQNYQKKAAQGESADAGPLGVIDPIWDVQVIVAVNKKSQLGRKPLNAVLQQLLNPNGVRVAGNPFRVGDKIINTKNGSYANAMPEVSVRGRWTERKEPYFDEKTEQNDVEIVREFIEDPNGPDESTSGGPKEKVYVANGEQAEVLEVTATRIIARLTQPDRTILIPRSAKADGDDGEQRPSDDSGDDESKGSGCAWELGFAISCHKSQGSEWPVVIVMLDDYNGAKMVQSKQWLYTGISRAKKLCLMIGKSSNANDMCSRDALFKRKTFLKEQIVDLRETSGISLIGEAPNDVEDSTTAIQWTDDLVGQLLEGVC